MQHWTIIYVLSNLELPKYPRMQSKSEMGLSICTITQNCRKLFNCQLLLMFSLQERVPFAVVGSNMILECNGKRVRGRQYPWGIAEGKNTL